MTAIITLRRALAIRVRKIEHQDTTGTMKEAGQCNLAPSADEPKKAGNIFKLDVVAPLRALRLARLCIAPCHFAIKELFSKYHVYVSHILASLFLCHQATCRVKLTRGLHVISREILTSCTCSLLRYAIALLSS